MNPLSTLLLAAACYIAPANAGPPSNDAPFPASLSDCGGKYVTEVNNSLNYYRCSNWNDGIAADDDQKFVLFDAYYNGSLTLNYVPIGAETRRPYLETINASLAIGQMNLGSNSQISRSKWDANNFFMEIDSFPPECNSSQTCAPYIHATSSSSYWYWSQAWTLTDTKNGDGYDISGNVTKTKAMSGSQGMYFSFPSDATHGIQTYNLYDFTIPRDPVSMTGHISPTDANLTFTISNFHSGSAAPFATLEFVFSGKAWKDGAQLVTTGDHPTTTGQAKAAKAASPSGTSTSTSTSKPLSTIIGAAAGGGVLILLIVIGLVFCCCLGSVMSCFRRKKQQSQMNQQWQQQQQQQAPPVVQYGSAGQYTAPPPPAASAQYGARPQGQPQAYPPAYAPQQAAYHPPTGNPQY